MNYTVTVPPAIEPVTLTEAKAHLNVSHTDDDALIRQYLAVSRDAIEREIGYFIPPVTVEWILDFWPCENFIQVKGPVQSVTEIAYFDSDNVEQVWSSAEYFIDYRRGRIYPLDNESFPSGALRRAAAIRITYRAGMVSEFQFTADEADDLIQFSSNPGVPLHAFGFGQDVLLYSNGTLPAGLSSEVRYYTREVDTYQLKLSVTRPGAAVVDITDTGEGDFYMVGGVPASLRGAILLGLGTLYENRENDVVEVGVALIPELPSGVRRLLSNYRARAF